MKLTIMVISVLMMGAMAVQANPLPDPWCDWESGETVAYVYGTGEPAIFATVTEPPIQAPDYPGSMALRLEDNSPSGTPYAVVAYLYGLSDGAQVTAGFWRYDDTPDAAPSCRIWGHWNDSLPDDVEAYDGSAGGNSEYGTGEGWDYVEHTWTVEDGHTGLVIEARVYSNAGDVVYIDNLYIDPPVPCTIWTPCYGEIVDTDETSMDALKALYR